MICSECGRPLFDEHGSRGQGNRGLLCESCKDRHRAYDLAVEEERLWPDASDHDDPVSQVRRNRSRGYA